MVKYLIFFITIVLLLGCNSSNDNTTAETTVDTSVKCATTKQTNVTSTTDRPMLVILLNYKNIQTTSSIEAWAQKIFSKNEGSLNDYYQEVSKNQFEFSEATECNGLASVYLDKNHPNTSIDTNSFDSAVHPDLALALASLDDNISFDIYDTNGDGHIQADELLITFIIAGYEDAYEGNHVTNGVWAHQYCTNSTYTPLLDGVSIMSCINNGNFALFGEKHNVANPHDATIGIIAHELGHSAFSLPDLYLGGGIGNFGLMGSGMWGYADNTEDDGQTPVHMTAWSKFYNDWITLDDNTTGQKTINATSSSSYNVVKVPNGEKYLLLENRDNSGYDRGLYMLDGTFNGGLAIWEIDETKTTQTHIDLNSVNSDSSNQGVYMLDAQGGFISDGVGGNENALFYNQNVASYSTSQASITNISVRGSVMTLDVN